VKENNSKVLFWGSGSIGSLFGGLLSLLPELQISLLGRDPHIEQIRNQGLIINKRNSPTVKIPIIHGYSVLPVFSEPFDIVFISCKARDNIESAQDLEEKRVIGEKTKLVIIQNGVGNEEYFLHLVPKENIFRIITTEGALILEPGKIMHSGPGKTLVGKPYDNNDDFSDQLVAWLNFVGLESNITNQIQVKTWAKLLINAPINPIATLYHVTNGELVTNPQLRKMLEDVVNETVEILRRRNIPFDDDDPIESVIQVAKATAMNKCSMLQDIEKGRRTEIDFLNGRLLQEAHLGGIPAPLNESLTLRIKKLESML
jgi:2-dehydropantoate 2-reductase